MDQKIKDVIWSCAIMLILTLVFILIVHSSIKKEEPKQSAETVSVEVTKVEPSI